MRFVAVLSFLLASAAFAQTPTLQRQEIANSLVRCYYVGGYVQIYRLGTACPVALGIPSQQHSSVTTPPPTVRSQPYDIAGNQRLAKPVDSALEAQAARNAIRLQELEIQRLEQQQASENRCLAIAKEVHQLGREILATKDRERAALLTVRSNYLLTQLEGC